MYIEYDFKKGIGVFLMNLLNFAEVLILALWTFLMEPSVAYYIVVAALSISLITNAVLDGLTLKRVFEVRDGSVNYYYKGKTSLGTLDELKEVEFYGEDYGQHLMKLTFKKDEDKFKIKTIDLAKMNQYDRGRVKGYFDKLGIVK